jgi:hypothetical protein
LHVEQQSLWCSVDRLIKSYFRSNCRWSNRSPQSPLSPVSTWKEATTTPPATQPLG